jgi:hypothetical protein
MQIIINDYERGQNSISYDNLKTQMSVSRIMLDFLLEKAISKGLIQKKIIDGLYEETTTFFLRDKGRQYASQHKLVEQGHFLQV